MFGIFKKNPASAVLVGLLIALSLWVPSFLTPLPVADDAPMMPLKYWLMQLVQLNPLASTIAAFVLMYVLSIMLMRLSAKHFFAQAQIYVPPFIFVLICSAFPIQRCMSGSYMATFCVMLGLFQLLNVYRNKRVFASIFLAALCISLASLFSAQAIFLLLLLPIALLLLRTPTTEWRDWVIALCGALLPYLYAFVAYMFIENDGFIIFQTLNKCLFASLDWFLDDEHIVEWTYLAYLVLLVLLAMLMLARGSLTSRIKVQKIHTLFVWGFFILLAVIVALPSGSIPLMPTIAVPASVLIANYFTLTKHRRMAGLLFYLLILLTYAIQYYDLVVNLL